MPGNAIAALRRERAPMPLTAERIFHPVGFESSVLQGPDYETTRLDTAANLKALVVIEAQRTRADIGAKLQGLVVIVEQRTRADAGAELQGLVVVEQHRKSTPLKTSHK